MLSIKEKNNTYIPATDNMAWWGYFINNGNWYPRYFDKYIIRLLYAAEQGRVSKYYYQFHHGMVKVLSSPQFSHLIFYVSILMKKLSYQVTVKD
jgi:hypothetical protein